jgi:hypothetical protein
MLLYGAIPCLMVAVLGELQGVCEVWCFDTCLALNGNVQKECNGCSAAEGHKCYPGAEGYDDWHTRAQKPKHVALDAYGNQIIDPDAPVERTSKSVVYAAKYYELASKKRGDDNRVVGATQQITDLTEYEEYPLPMPQESPRSCEVHSCVLIGGDDVCANAMPECAEPKGHLRPIGEQSEMRPAAVHDQAASPLDAPGFWQTAMSKAHPLMIKGGTAAWTNLTDWTDEALLEVCMLSTGRPWNVLVEKQNRITQNDRNPLMGPDWDFCKFLTEYRKPEYKNMLYLVTGIAEKGLRLAERLRVPDVLACDELLHGLYDARMWMSLGNTTSSMHFDTHDNLLLQLSGEKEVLMWHPKDGGKFYMDHFEKFGLSPVNVDRVDLQRFPAVANATTYLANLSAGDAVYIPDGWWHVIRSHSRNIAVALEIAPYQGEGGVWPSEVLGRKSAPGVYWAEQISINAAMREQLATQIPSRYDSKPIKCDAPLADRPPTLADVSHLGKEPTFH